LGDNQGQKHPASTSDAASGRLRLWLEKHFPPPFVSDETEPISLYILDLKVKLVWSNYEINQFQVTEMEVAFLQQKRVGETLPIN
jgi:hypothetical protein